MLLRIRAHLRIHGHAYCPEPSGETSALTSTLAHGSATHTQPRDHFAEIRVDIACMRQSRETMQSGEAAIPSNLDEHSLEDTTSVLPHTS